MKKARFPIGTKYKSRGKYPRLCTITDIYTITNSNGEVVKINYVSTHEFSGQIVINHDVCDTTIAMGLLHPPKESL